MNYPDDFINKVIQGDCLEIMRGFDSNSIDLVITSPPYNTARVVKTDRGLRNLENRYIGYEDNKTDEEYINWTREIMNGLERVLNQNGCILYNLSYSSENTTLIWLVIADIIKSTKLTVSDCIIWKKFSAIPNNVSPNKLTRICEYVFVLCRKSEINTFYMNKKITGQSSTGQTNYENVFNFITAPNNDGAEKTHKATFSSTFVAKLINMYAKEDALILDPFMGTGTTAVAARNLKRNYLGIELNPEYIKIANERLRQEILL